MSSLHTLKIHPRSRKARKRVGRGPGSGVGKTSGRGHKGQMQRGPGPRAGFEGGQMPLLRTMPKRGFTALAVVKYQILNVDDLERLKFKGEVGVEQLLKANVIRSRRMPVKLLGKGEIKTAVNVRLQAASKSALEKIKKAGGSFEAVKLAVAE